MQATVQLLKTALYHEIKSGAFYNRASEITKNDESRMLFIELSDIEDSHINNLIKKAKNTLWPEEFSPEAYLKEIESSMENIISAEEMKMLQKGDMTAVLELAISMEKQAHQTYMELAEKAATQEVKNLSLELAEEEQEHLNSLTSMLTSLNMDEKDRPSL